MIFLGIRNVSEGRVAISERPTSAYSVEKYPNRVV